MPQAFSVSLEVTAKEAETLYQASRGELTCPKCQQPLKAELSLCIQGPEMVYDGVTLHCPPGQGCGQFTDL